MHRTNEEKMENSFLNIFKIDDNALFSLLRPVCCFVSWKHPSFVKSKQNAVEIKVPLFPAVVALCWAAASDAEVSSGWKHLVWAGQGVQPQTQPGTTYRWDQSRLNIDKHSINQELTISPPESKVVCQHASQGWSQHPPQIPGSTVQTWNFWVISHAWLKIPLWHVIKIEILVMESEVAIPVYPSSFACWAAHPSGVTWRKTYPTPKRTIEACDRMTEGSTGKIGRGPISARPEPIRMLPTTDRPTGQRSPSCKKLSEAY